MIADKDSILAPGAKDEKVVGLGREGVLMVFGGLTCLRLRGSDGEESDNRGKGTILRACGRVIRIRGK